MNTHLLALQLMAAQGILGAFDTIYHHELTQALPQQPGARRELTIHAMRALLYSVLFIGLGTCAWHGAWTIVMMVIFAIEIGLTLWDFVIEDRTRLLPPTERITHTILAINGGAFIALLVLTCPAWLAQPTGLIVQPPSPLGLFLVVCGVGVGLSGVRDGMAARKLGTAASAGAVLPPIRFGAAAQRVLVTGGTGFIGQPLVHALLADGHEVTLVTRRPRQAAWQFSGRVRCVCSLDELQAGQEVDVVVNLAGAPILGWRWTTARKTLLRHSRIGVTNQLIEWIARAERKPRLLMSASAIGYYGIQARGASPALTEDAPSQPIFMSQLCADWEAAALRARAHGVRVACLRFGLVLGKQGALPMMLLPVRLGLGGALGSGDQWQSWIHVHDLLRGIAHVWSHNLHADPTPALTGAVNFTAPGPMTQIEFSRTAAQVMRRPCVMRTPGFPLRFILGEQADLLLEGQRVLPQRLESSGFSFRFPDLRSALDHLG